MTDSATPPCRAVAHFEICDMTCDFISTLVSSPPAGQTGPYVYECQASVSQGTGPFTYQWSPSPEIFIEPDGRIVRISLPDNARHNIDLTVTDSTDCEAVKTHRVGAINYTLEADPDDGAGTLQGERENAHFEVRLTATADDTEESPAADLELEFRRPATREVFHMTLLLEAGTNPPVYRRTWNDVTTKMGRWDIKVNNGNSNTLNFKIDKRKQIVQLAEHWAGLGLSRDDVACSCDSFTNGIYAQVGLIPQNAVGGADRSNYGLLAPDSGDGALIFFWYRSNKTGTDDGTPSHIGILAGGDRIDCNGARTFSESGAGPSSNPQDRWCSNYRIAIGDWFWGGTLPTRTVVDPAGGSLLEALDAE